MATYETASDQSIIVNGIKFAYRKFGRRDGVPLTLFVGFRGTMDMWDPALVNPVASKRPILLIDNAGVGRSGETFPNFEGLGKNYIDVIRALGMDKIDIMGFSMGGCVAQLVALDAPDLTRRLILCGTIPSMGNGVLMAPLGPFNKLKAAVTEQEQKEAFLDGLFNHSEQSRRAGEEAWGRITTSRRDVIAQIDAASARRQGIAFVRFMDPKQAGDGTYKRLGELSLPILIANGAEDLLLPTENSYLMWKLLSKGNARLHLFSDSGHGFLFQYAKEFSKLINDFLDNEPEQKPLSRL